MSARVGRSSDLRRNRGYKRELSGNLLHETIRAEVRAYYFEHPMGSQLIIRESVMDFINAAMEKGAELARAVSNKFSDGWEALSAGIEKALGGVGDTTIEKAKNGVAKLQELANLIDSRISDEIKQEIRRKSPGLARLEQEGAELADVAQDPGIEIKIGSEAGQDVADAARELQREGARAQRRFVMLESETIATQLRLESLREDRGTGKRGVLREAFDPVSTFLMFITVVGAIGLVLTFLRWVFEKIGNRTGWDWASRTGSWLHKVEHAWHHAEAMMVDYMLPDIAVVELYNLYIYLGGAPVEGDVGRVERSHGDEVFGTDGVETSPKYAKGKLLGKFGSSRQLSVDDVRVTKDMPGEERARRNSLRESIEKRIWTIMIFILLVQALVTLAAKGLSALYAFKGGVKAGEVGIHVAPEIGAAIRGAEISGVEMLGAAAAGAGAGALTANRLKA